MAKKGYTFPRMLKHRNLTVRTTQVTSKQFQQMRKTEPEIPIRSSDIRRLSRSLFPSQRQRKRVPKKIRIGRTIIDLTDECMEYAYGLLFSALKNPRISRRDLDAVDADMDDAIPDFESMLETDHFILRWTNNSAHPGDNIPPDQEDMVAQVGEYLEYARTIYINTFNLEPYILPGTDKIEILFYDLGINTNGGTLDTLSYIKFNSQKFITNEHLRKPVSAHELFHRVQYQAGYRTNPTHEKTGYFVEGTTSWAETFVWKAVSNDLKIKAFYSASDTDLLTLSGSKRYWAGAFWHFVEKRINKVVDFMDGYAATGKVTDTLRAVVEDAFPPNGVYGNLENFLTLWHRNRITKENHPDNIQGPDGIIINPSVASANFYTINAANPGLVIQGSNNPRGVDYIRIALSGLQGKELQIDFQGQGDFCIQFHLFNYQFKWRRGFYPFFALNQFANIQSIGDDESYLWVLIGGRDNGGDYTLEITGLY